jgi:hypothetical protein
MATILLLILVLTDAVAALPGEAAARERRFQSFYWVPATLLAISWLARDPLSRALSYAVVFIPLSLFLASLYLTTTGVLLFRRGLEDVRPVVHLGRLLVAALPLGLLGLLILLD